MDKIENAPDEPVDEKLRFFEYELKNFQDIAVCIKPSPGEIPSLQGIDIAGEVIPFNSVIGGDHIIYVDFKKRYDLDSRIKEAMKAGRQEVADKLKTMKNRAGIMLIDVSGHNITDAMLAAMLHQAFLIGVIYELKQNGEVTIELFENLNTRFYNSSSITKFITFVYGEIFADGRFHFINAGFPAPMVFSFKYNNLQEISLKRMVHVQPIGTLPSKEDVDVSRHLSRLGYKAKYSVNEINLMGAGDILLLFSDGFSEHNREDTLYIHERLETTLRSVKDQSARQICQTLKEDMLQYAPPNDDVSLVVIKKLA